MTRLLGFRAVDAADGAGPVWAAEAHRSWEYLLTWMDVHRLTAESDERARRLCGRHLPELLPVLDRLAAPLGRPGALSALAHTALLPFAAGCTQTAVDGALIRNYDFWPDKCERTVLLSRFLRPVLGTREGLSGLLDGMNDAGLAVSLTFGGRPVHGEGVSILLVVRYLLETCKTVAEAWRRLRTIPVSTAQNLTLVDGREAVSVHLGPDRTAVRIEDPCAANHQDEEIPAEQEEFSRTRLRLETVRAATAEAAGRPDAEERIAAALHRPPFYRTDVEGLFPIYTAAYRPAEGRVAYLWPGHRREQSFARFEPGEWTVEAG